MHTHERDKAALQAGLMLAGSFVTGVGLFVLAAILFIRLMSMLLA